MEIEAPITQVNRSLVQEPAPWQSSDGTAPLKPTFFTAIVTPLHEDDTLDTALLERLIADQFDAGIDGLLIAGSMGMMQQLTDQTYRRLVTRALEYGKGRGELLVGAGDTSLARTQERLAFLNTLPVDGVVVLAPYIWGFDQDELLGYYRALADAARAPLFLYDLPQTTHSKIELATALKLAEHPNIAGIKCSDEPSYARQLRDLAPEGFRVIMAAPLLIDTFLRQGIREHLDGIYCLCPRQIVALGKAALAGDWQRVEGLQRQLNGLMRLIRAYPTWHSISVLLHEVGLPGRFSPHPHRPWSVEQARAFLELEETQAVLRFLHWDDFALVSGAEARAEIASGP